MTRYRAHQWAIEAWQYPGHDGWGGRPGWLLEAIMAGHVWQQGGEVPYLTLDHGEKHLRVDIGDWLLRGPSGWVYRCDPITFAASYEEIRT